MATPDYLQQVIVSARAKAANDRRSYSTRFGLFRRPSMTSVVWASLDLMVVIVATILALRIRVGVPTYVPVLYVVPDLIESSPRTFFLYIAWFAVCLVFFTRSYGLYGPIQNRSGLHEQRMTVQAVLTSGLLLCGALYLFNGVAVSRIVVALLVLFSMILLCARRAIWRQMAYNRFRQGIETRNVLIVGAGRVGYALRNHLESLQHLGFRFKGFVALTEREAESEDAEIVGDLRNCLSLALSLPCTVALCR